jgi:hypothetical protein
VSRLPAEVDGHLTSGNIFTCLHAPFHFASVSAEEERVSDFELKLMDIDSEHLGIPDTDYAATVNLPAAEYQRICRDLSSIGDTGEDH